MSKDDTLSSQRPSTDQPLAQALARLNDALDLLDRRVDETLERQPASLAKDEEVQRLAQDRAKLAAQVDSEKARGDRLAQINGEVSRRLVGAMETVKKVLDSRA